ncbi:MAG TPA: LysR family transcriptional regulator [Casimicrobiaceae bacterium]
MTRAAEQLGIQQPPLSQQIKALEGELKTQLFKRVARGVELTIAGAAFRYDAQTILRQVELAASRAASIAVGVEGSIAVGFSTSAAAHALVPRLINAFRDAHPGVSLDVRESNAAELSDWIAKGTLQAAIFRAPVSRPTGVAFYSLLQEPMLLVLPVRHPLAAARKSAATAISLRALRDEGFILVRRPGAPGMYADFISACREQGFTPRIVAEVDRMLTNICLVAAGFGISVVPTSMRGFHAESVAYCPLRNSHLAAPMTLAYREQETNPAAIHFIALGKTLAKAWGKREELLSRRTTKSLSSRRRA